MPWTKVLFITLFYYLDISYVDNHVTRRTSWTSRCDVQRFDISFSPLNNPESRIRSDYNVSKHSIELHLVIFFIGTTLAYSAKLSAQLKVRLAHPIETTRTDGQSIT